MKFKDIRQWLPMLLFGVPAVWLGLYFWAWMARTGCSQTPLGECLITAIANWGADVVLLQWVKGYQDLISGVLTLVAGAAVVFVAFIQRQHLIQDRKTERRQKIKQHLSEAIILFEKSIQELQQWQFDRARQTLDNIEVLVTTLSDGGADVANTFVYFTATIRGRLDWISDVRKQDTNDARIQSWRKEAIGVSMVASTYLQSPDRFFGTMDTAVHSKKKPTDFELARLNDIGIPLKQIPYSTAFLDY